MATHEFGIMPQPPLKGERFDEYTPEKYSCIFVDDEWVEPVLPALAGVPVYWHSLDTPRKGLCYCGITLIPPQALGAFLNAVKGKAGLEELSALLLQARREDAFVIHFGI